MHQTSCIYILPPCLFALATYCYYVLTMASIGKNIDEYSKASGYPRGPQVNLFTVDFALRCLLVALTVSSLGVTVTSNQTKLISSPFISPNNAITMEAKFTYSSAIIYYVSGISVACLYSVLTAVASALAISEPSPSTGLLHCLATLDALMAGIVASGTGAVASIAYIGLKGNNHIGWQKVCGIFDKFCRHAGIAIAISLVASIVLVVLVGISTYSLHRRNRQT